MDIHFISTLTPEDEDRLAPAVVGTIRAILDVLPISYTVRLQTTNGRVFHHTKAEELGQPHEIDQTRAAFANRRMSLT
jgi:hypothetical protein